MKLKRYIFLLLFSTSVFAQEPNLLDLSIEELMNVTITSFDGTPKELKKTPAAIHVISKEDIAKSSATNVPELLRGVPGLHVAQIDSHTWSISSRGFARRYSNKLLVLIDGRSIYSPLFAGVYWDQNDVPLIDIERIEIIRGPGGSLWGANAVNGVINIITKSSRDELGSQLVLGAGDYHQGYVNYRFSDLINKSLSYKLTLKGTITDNFKTSDGDESIDDWKQYRIDTRVDWSPSTKDEFSFFAGTHKTRQEDEILVAMPPPVSLTTEDDTLSTMGYYFMGNWEHKIDEKSKTFIRAYHDFYDEEDLGPSEKLRTSDIDIRYTLEASETHKFTLGAGYRIVEDEIDNVDFGSFLPESEEYHTFRLYGQDEIAILKDELNLILGIKYEKNDFTGSEWQPSAKLVWTPTQTHTFWSSVSRAVRTPSRGDEDISYRLFYAGPTEVRATGQRGLDSESLIAYELGYRFTPDNSDLSLDFALFYNDYDKFYAFESTTVPLGRKIVDTEEGYTMGG
ncbi:MAG: TonB-dependent receptor, partial [Lentisphaeraceae bacterium]|nr:TonB-dependent receptor [Lentisphaeraceae bacterium]